MSKVADVCAHVRSKNAGPFWITVDFFFDDEEDYRRYRDSPTLGPALFAELYQADPQLVKRFAVDSLRIIKVSFERPHPQGWMHERDMHAGQQYVRLLDVVLEPGVVSSSTR
jgi:Domain of unknown function (DUF4387)